MALSIKTSQLSKCCVLAKAGCGRITLKVLTVDKYLKWFLSFVERADMDVSVVERRDLAIKRTFERSAIEIEASTRLCLLPLSLAIELHTYIRSNLLRDFSLLDHIKTIYFIPKMCPF